MSKVIGKAVVKKSNSKISKKTVKTTTKKVKATNMLKITVIPNEIENPPYTKSFTNKSKKKAVD